MGRWPKPECACGAAFPCVQVLSVEVPGHAGGPLPAHAKQATLYVWDGTDATPFPRRCCTQILICTYTPNPYIKRHP